MNLQVINHFARYGPAHPATLFSINIIARDQVFPKKSRHKRRRPVDLEPLFRQEVLKLLKAHGLPSSVIENRMGWHHSGFNVYCSPAIWPGNDTGIENLARYIIRERG